ncbi:MAG TPA: copper resistance protein CopC [Acidobacteriota bacterium]|nr:copper resistance protein CopC [Acidobacteriota bacterium]
MTHTHEHSENERRSDHGRWDSRILALLVAFAIPTLLAAAPTAPHLRLTGSAPEQDTVLDERPAEIRLWFSLAPELAVSRIVLSCHDAEELGELQAGDENSLYAEVLSDLEPGDHAVTWRTSSGDGHPIRGTIPFSTSAAR